MPRISYEPVEGATDLWRVIFDGKEVGALEFSKALDRWILTFGPSLNSERYSRSKQTLMDWAEKNAEDLADRED